MATAEELNLLARMALPGLWSVRILLALPVSQRLASLLSLPLGQRPVGVMQPEEGRGEPPT